MTEKEKPPIRTFPLVTDDGKIIGHYTGRSPLQAAKKTVKQHFTGEVTLWDRDLNRYFTYEVGQNPTSRSRVLPDGRVITGYHEPFAISRGITKPIDDYQDNTRSAAPKRSRRRSRPRRSSASNRRSQSSLVNQQGDPWQEDELLGGTAWRPGNGALTVTVIESEPDVDNMDDYDGDGDGDGYEDEDDVMFDGEEEEQLIGASPVSPVVVLTPVPISRRMSRRRQGTRPSRSRDAIPPNRPVNSSNRFMIREPRPLRIRRAPTARFRQRDFG